MGGWLLDFTRLMLISTQVEAVVKVGVELGNINKHIFRAVGISGFLTRSLTGEAFYFTLFWIVFGKLQV